MYLYIIYDIFSFIHIYIYKCFNHIYVHIYLCTTYKFYVYLSIVGGYSWLSKIITVVGGPNDHRLDNSPKFRLIKCTWLAWVLFLRYVTYLSV